MGEWHVIVSHVPENGEWEASTELADGTPVAWSAPTAEELFAAVARDLSREV